MCFVVVVVVVVGFLFVFLLLRAIMSSYKTQNRQSEGGKKTLLQICIQSSFEG